MSQRAVCACVFLWILITGKIENSIKKIEHFPNLSQLTDSIFKREEIVKNMFLSLACVQAFIRFATRDQHTHGRFRSKIE